MLIYDEINIQCIKHCKYHNSSKVILKNTYNFCAPLPVFWSIHCNDTYHPTALELTHFSGQGQLLLVYPALSYPPDSPLEKGVYGFDPLVTMVAWNYHLSLFVLVRNSLFYSVLWWCTANWRLLLSEPLVQRVWPLSADPEDLYQWAESAGHLWFGDAQTLWCDWRGGFLRAKGRPPLHSSYESSHILASTWLDSQEPIKKLK